MARDDLNVYNRRHDVRPGPVAHRLAGPFKSGEAHPAAAQPSRGAPTRKPPRNNVFADPGGNVYRKTLDGWERRDHDKWVAPPKPSTPAPAAARPVPSPTPPHAIGAS